ncbi:hypothetical protein JCM10212_007122 [Sporobolomyces blumeae]
MLKGFFGGVSQPQDQTTPKASDQRNPFDSLAAPSLTPAQSRRGSTQAGIKTPTLRPSLSYTGQSQSPSGFSTPGAGSSDGLTTPGATVPGTPGGRALPTTEPRELRGRARASVRSRGPP